MRDFSIFAMGIIAVSPQSARDMTCQEALVIAFYLYFSWVREHGHTFSIISDASFDEVSYAFPGKEGSDSRHNS